jgi:hypothetical protein
MELIPGVGHVDDIGDRILRQSWIALCRQVSLLVLIFEEARFRCVLFAEDQMPDDAKSCTTPGVEELVDLCPAVERDHETILLENAAGFAKCWHQPV